MGRPRDKERRELSLKKTARRERRQVQFQPLLTIRTMTRRTQIPGINLTGINMKILEKEMGMIKNGTMMGYGM
eukprot:5061124-Prorocentrum_lima.AAC.1